MDSCKTVGGMQHTYGTERDSIEAECYDTGSDVVEGLEEVIIIRTTTEYTEIAWKVSRGGRWRLNHRVCGHRDITEE